LRFIFQLLIGMILFNAMLFIFGPYFPSHHLATGVDVANSSAFTSYQSLDIKTILYNFFYAFVGSFFVSIFIGYVSGGTLPLGQLLGASLVISVFVGLWNGLTSPLVGIANSFPTIMPFYTIFTIVLGVVVMISVVEIFTGKGDETT
jgi:hypothetical protein